MPNEPSSDATLVTPEQVHQELDRLLRDRNHMGVRNLIGDRLLDPRNPFQRTRRQPKKWVVAIGGLALLALMIVHFFRVR